MLVSYRRYSKPLSHGATLKILLHKKVIETEQQDVNLILVKQIFVRGMLTVTTVLQITKSFEELGTEDK